MNDIANANRVYFNRWADKYDLISGQWDTSLERRRVKDILTSVVKRGDRVLDLGTGTGFLIPILEKLSDDITGIDVSDKSIEAARRTYPAHKFVCADIEDFRGDFDVVVSSSFLHHLRDYMSAIDKAMSFSPKIIFINHEPNYYFHRMFFPMLRLIWKNYKTKPIFKGETDGAMELCEYHQYYKPGVNPLEIKKALKGYTARIYYANSAMFNFFKINFPVDNWGRYLSANFSILAVRDGG